MAIGGMSKKGESQEISRPTIIAQLKMEDAYIFCIIIEIIW